MGLKMKIIKKEEQLTSKWSGGTTTQLFIYPEEASYTKRNFLWRLSSAEVQLKESEFTYLPGVERIILPITGEMLLEHKDHYKKLLKPFEQDCFSGEWITKSYGKVTDFNLMLRGCRGNLEVLTLTAYDNKNIVLETPGDNIENIAYGFYILGGRLQLVVNEKHIFLEDKDLLLIIGKCEMDNYKIFIKNDSEKQIKIIRTNIFY